MAGSPLLAQVLPTRTELVPWTDRKGRLHPLRATVFVLLLLPALVLAARWLGGMLGPERVNAAIHNTGFWTIWLLVASLTVTPLKVLGGLPNVVVVRRMIGNAALCYAALHLVLYSVDQHWRVLTIVAEIVKRFYLTIGFFALAGLVVLGLTSTDGWIRRLGKTWKRLHRVVYALVVLGLVHYLLQSKLDVSASLVAAGVFTWLMAWRVLPTGPDRDWRPLLGITVASALLTLAYEYLWYRFGTRINPVKVVLSEADIGFGLHPAGEVLLLGLLATGGAELRRLSQADSGGTLLFTTSLFALGAFCDDIGALLMGWSYDDVLPVDMTPAVFDVMWFVILALLGVARWRLRTHRSRRLLDGLWVAAVTYQIALVGFGNRDLGLAMASGLLAVVLVFAFQVWSVSRGAALLLLPMSAFLAVRVISLF